MGRHKIDIYRKRFRRPPNITIASDTTTSPMPAHCQALMVSPSTSIPALTPTSGTARLNGATRLTAWRLSSPVQMA